MAVPVSNLVGSGPLAGRPKHGHRAVARIIARVWRITRLYPVPNTWLF